uniref:atherin-like n=1 Tax=Odobenus rosmarus divergens TaxID=9708 RepID=UPI00063C9623|nr:PREDICTED: atherin-like [Odobenus rosmarus divergens]
MAICWGAPAHAHIGDKGGRAGSVITIKGKRSSEAAPRRAAGSQAPAPSPPGAGSAPAPFKKSAGRAGARRPRPREPAARGGSARRRPRAATTPPLPAGRTALAPAAAPGPSAHAHTEPCPQPPPGRQTRRAHPPTHPSTQPPERASPPARTKTRGRLGPDRSTPGARGASAVPAGARRGAPAPLPVQLAALSRREAEGPARPQAAAEAARCCSASRAGNLPGGGVNRRWQRRSGEGEGPVLAGWTRSRRWLRVAPPGFIGRRRGRSSHKRQLSERRALIGPAPLTHRPRSTVSVVRPHSPDFQPGAVEPKAARPSLGGPGAASAQGSGR